MTTHVKVLGVLYIAFSLFLLCAALFLFFAVGTAAGIVGANADSSDAAIALPIIGLAGTALVGFLVILALPGLVAGIGLLQFRPWARILAIVLGVLHLIHIPLGTIFGIYTLWVLLNKQTEPLFGSSPSVPSTTM
jgi:hypothetical protein